MAQRFSQLVLGGGVIACFACGGPPTAPASDVPPPNVSTVSATPPIRGLVREAGGGPIAGIAVRLTSSGAGTGVTTPSIETDAAGRFAFTPSTELCQNAQSVWLQVSSLDFTFFDYPVIRCTRIPNPPEVSVEAKGQRVITVVSGAPVQFTVSNDDINWMAHETGFSCGPCKAAMLKFPHHASTIDFEWSSSVPFYIWIDGFHGYDQYGLREIVASPAQTSVRVTVPADWRNLALQLKVGVPYGGRFPAGSPPVTMRVEVR